MLHRTIRTIATASLLSAGLFAWSGCSTENPDGTKTATGKAEDKVVEGAKAVEKAAVEAGHKVKEGAEKAVDSTGKALEETGKKLEGAGKDAVKDKVGDTAAGVVEGAGKGLEKAGEKLQDAVKKPD